MLVSWASWFPLRRLQSWQQATRFSQVDSPPRERGITWSSVSSPDDMTLQQYWQVLRSRKRMFLRDSARVWCGMRRYSSRRITEGTRMVKRVECRKWPFSSSARATPLSTRTIARRAAHTLMGSYDAFSTSTGANMGARELDSTATTTGSGADCLDACDGCGLDPCLPIFPLCLRRPCPFYRNLFAFHDACHRGDIHFFRSCPTQRARAFGSGRTSGEHIINQDDVMPLDLVSIADDKRSAHVLAALMARESGLRARTALAEQNGILEREFGANLLRQSPKRPTRDQLRLIELALTLFVLIKRYRYQEGLTFAFLDKRLHHRREQ